MRFFDPTDELLITQRKLPHWAQDDSVVFITWRTHDSMPKNVVERWRAERNRWLVAHSVDPTQKRWKTKVQNLPAERMLEFHQYFTTRWHDELDACHGACVLAQPSIADILQNSLLHFHGGRYDMLRFVIMPNHVHLLASFPDKETMVAQCDSWKHFTGREINRHLGTQGRFWQQDAFDHLVRHEPQFHRLCDYIAQNPAKARLRPEQARIWSSVQ